MSARITAVALAGLLAGCGEVTVNNVPTTSAPTATQTSAPTLRSTDPPTAKPTEEASVTCYRILRGTLTSGETAVIEVRNIGPSADVGCSALDAQDGSTTPQGATITVVTVDHLSSDAHLHCSHAKNGYTSNVYDDGSVFSNAEAGGFCEA